MTTTSEIIEHFAKLTDLMEIIVTEQIHIDEMREKSNVNQYVEMKEEQLYKTKQLYIETSRNI